MASSLQQQLSAIAAKSTHQLDLKVQKARHSKSLLYEPHDASLQRFDNLYQICVEGFEELCQLDARFAPYGRNLFSEQSQNEERTQMTRRENEELDKVIEAFLGLLGSRLLLKPGMKAAEWLVRRFQVHEYNTEALLLTFLPYHNSQVFPTLLSILPEQLPANFRFLHPYVASLQSPPRAVVVAAASRNPAFFTAFSQNILSIAKSKHHSATILGFWASVTAQAVSSMVHQSSSGRDLIRRQKEEDVLLRVLPVIQSALLIKDVPEMYLGACMIMTIVATQAPPENKVLDAMMEAVTAGWTKQTFEDGLTCLAVLAEERSTLEIPQAVASAILDQDDCFIALKRIMSGCRVDRLLLGASLAIIRQKNSNGGTRAREFLLALPNFVDFPEHHISVIMQAAMEMLQDASRTNQLVDRDDLIAFLRIYFGRPDCTEAIRRAAKQTDFQLSHLGAHTLNETKSIDFENSDDLADNSSNADIKSTNGASGQLVDLSTLPTLADGYSFLAPAQEFTFQRYADAFRFSLKDQQLFDAFITHDNLENTALLEQSRFLTFLARVWASELPIYERLRALQTARETLAKAAHAEPPPIDMQALLPYLMCCLSDSAREIRLEAAAICRVLDAFCQAQKQHSRQTQEKTWSKDSFYGHESAAVNWLSSADSSEVLSNILTPILEDCVLDPSFLVNAMISILNASGKITASDLARSGSNLRQALCETLASHAVTSPSISVRLVLFEVLSKVGKIASSARLTHLVPYIENSISHADKSTDKVWTAGTKTALIHCLSHRSTTEVQLLRSLASGELTSDEEVISSAFNRIRTVFTSSKEPTQIDLYDWLLELSVGEGVAEHVCASAVDTLRDVKLPTTVLVHAVEALPSVSSLQDHPTPAKKQRTSRSSDTPRPGSVQSSKLSSVLRRMTIVLELIEASEPEKHPRLLKGLFQLLGEMHHYKVVVGSDLVYLHGLLIGNLKAVVDGLKATAATDVDRSVIRADLIVECVRTTPNSQVHNAALLLMSSLASWAPDHVLHSVMPLFTFMSSTILKQGDDYSAHVTEQTVARIVPPLAASLRKKGKDLISGVADLLLSFTAAFEHIPLHRRAGIFEQLVHTLGADQSLFAVVAMLVERYRTDQTTTSFITTLISKFHVTVQLRALKQYFDLIFDTLELKRGLSDVILGYGDKNPKAAKQATAAMQLGLVNILTADTLRRQVFKELSKNSKTAEPLRLIYSELLEKAMQLALHVKDDESLQPSADRVLAALLRLMPTSDFIDASAKLMQSGTDEIRQQVFASLETRVASAKRGDATLQDVFIGVLPNCSLFIADTQPFATRHAAIACIDQIAERFGKTDRAAVVDAATLVVGQDALGSDDKDLRVISLLCLASMIEVAEDEFIPVLPRAVQKALDYTEEAIAQEVPDESTHRAAFSLVSAALQYLPWMLSAPDLDRALGLAAASASGAPEMAQVSRDFCLLAARKLPAQECFGTIDRSWAFAIRAGVVAAQQQLDMFAEAVRIHNKATIARHTTMLFAVLMAAFDSRFAFSGTRFEDSEEVRELYRSIDKVALDVVMKLNDATFRPFFSRLIDWATESEAKKQTTIRNHRCISLFSFASTLFEQLKSLVTSYCGPLLETATNLLQTLSLKQAEERELLDLILQALSSSFRHDQDGFWQAPAHYEAVAGPLLALLKKAPIVDVEQQVIPAITDLAAAAGSSEHHKSMNGTMMACMRHESAAVRLAAVKCERAVTSRLNLDWLALLPEMLPFISELQEDDDENVERETLRWVQQIEGVTGESLEGMLQ